MRIHRQVVLSLYRTLFPFCSLSSSLSRSVFVYFQKFSHQFIVAVCRICNFSLAPSSTQANESSDFIDSLNSTNVKQTSIKYTTPKLFTLDDKVKDTHPIRNTLPLPVQYQIIIINSIAKFLLFC